MLNLQKQHFLKAPSLNRPSTRQKSFSWSTPVIVSLIPLLFYLQMQTQCTYHQSPPHSQLLCDQPKLFSGLCQQGTAYPTRQQSDPIKITMKCFKFEANIVQNYFPSGDNNCHKAPVPPALLCFSLENLSKRASLTNQKCLKIDFSYSLW